MGKALIAVVAAVLALAAPGLAQTAYDGDGPDGPTKAYDGGDRCTIFRPQTLPATPSPVILWGNGTGTRPVDYAALLHHLASWGFVVAAANTPNAGSGADMLACLDWLTAENGRPGSPYQGRLDLAEVGATGHSQGGSGALMAGRDPRVKTVAPLNPGGRGAPAQAHGPMLLFSGGADVTAPPQRAQEPIYQAATVPVVWLTLHGASHFVAMRDAGPYRGALTAWFLDQLKGDAKARAMFDGEACGYCQDDNWTLLRRNGG